MQVPVTWALGKLGNEKAVDALIQSLKNSDWYVRWGAIEALGNIGDSRALEHLKKALDDKDEYVRTAAAEAIDLILS